ncbi:hypothetical protein [Niallia endozanthoxylica]|uniref:Uncharacterized protein n=1 Tax=Niallia endozanthoxylica TaxID=2036016 RepID=A0A5J5HT79_9BACI|nr:hypothetical protein [Niallia endozanthoxylica]KAA9023568.1 hypothetical protein F4V44_12945 [Niallia endozanthoxylica]
MKVVKSEIETINVQVDIEMWKKIETRVFHLQRKGEKRFDIKQKKLRKISKAAWGRELFHLGVSIPNTIDMLIRLEEKYGADNVEKVVCSLEPFFDSIFGIERKENDKISQ